MTRWIPHFRSVLGVLAVVAGAASGAAGQSLHLAELFADQGRVADARAEVLAWFEIRGSEATAEELQHGLFLRGRFAPDRAETLADMRRLVDDFPESRWTASALAWLAADAADQGEDFEAVALFTRVAREFPEVPEAGPAREFLRARGIVVEPAEPEPARPAIRHIVPAPPPRELPPAGPTDTVALEPAPADTAVAAEPVSADTAVVEPAPADAAVVVASEPADSMVAAEPAGPDSVAVERAPAPADTVAVQPVAADTAAAPPAESPPPVETPAEPEPERIPHGPPVPGAAAGGAWAVQIGAFRNPVGAAGLVDEMIEAGLDARLVQVPMNDLLRVRVGRFATQDEADAALERVRAAGWDGALVSDARQETVVVR